MENKNKSGISKKSLWTFIIGSLLGFVLFLLPVKGAESITVVTGLLSDWLSGTFYDVIMYFSVGALCIVSVLTLIGTLFKPDFITKNAKFSEWFITSPLYLVSRVLGTVVLLMCVFGFGPEFITSPATGGSMVGIAVPLIATVLAVAFFMPLLTDFGLMEIVGVATRKIVRPLFKVPGRSAIDLLSSWFGAANTAVLLTRGQYKKGYYTMREAASIMTNFSLVNIPFCLIVAQTTEMQQYFVPMYLMVCLIGIILAIVVVRIPPLTLIPNEYAPGVEKQEDEMIPEGMKPMQYAVKIASERASKNTLKGVLKDGAMMMLDVVITTIPVVYAWGTIATILVEYTPIFTWISYPFKLYLDLFGVAEAAVAAPATIVGFIDMFIPAILAGAIENLETRFIITALSLVQIIFLTEVGVLSMQSKVKLNFGNLFLIFLERTIIAIPLLVLGAKLIF
ncbi:MAG: YjiH family protein [Clostridia bacterium]|nr:YjiH family protein [Clostridia bacterium]